MRAFDRAFRDCFGMPGSIRAVDPAGRTDPEILDEVCRTMLGRLPTAEEAERLFQRYTLLLEEELKDNPDFRVLPGIRPLLEALDRDPRCFVGLGTGNIKEGARVKLSLPGLWRFFAFGGFGSDALKRVEVLQVALERGRALLDGKPDFSAAYVIGDTPRDVAAGRALGLRVIGVATGPYSEADLEEAGAWRVYPDLGDYPSLLGLLRTA